MCKCFKDILNFVEYNNPEYEALQFRLIVDRLVVIGYPSQIKDFEYDPTFPIRYETFHVNYYTK